VSRGPVREALQRLIQEGLLRSEPHRGVFVPVLTNEDIIDIYLAREALECAAVRHVSATDQMTTAYLALDKHVKAMEKAEAAEDWERVGRLDLEFHTALVAATGSQRLQRMFSTVISETQLCLGALTEADARHELVIEHRRICDWVRDGDTEQAVHALKQHFEAAVVTLTNGLGQGEDDASVVHGR
jgi:DNA-binding GntR family transcriptional regulator